MSWVCADCGGEWRAKGQCTALRHRLTAQTSSEKGKGKKRRTKRSAPPDRRSKRKTQARAALDPSKVVVVEAYRRGTSSAPPTSIAALYGRIRPG